MKLESAQRWRAAIKAMDVDKAGEIPLGRARDMLWRVVVIYAKQGCAWSQAKYMRCNRAKRRRVEGTIDLPVLPSQLVLVPTASRLEGGSIERHAKAGAALAALQVLGCDGIQCDWTSLSQLRMPAPAARCVAATRRSTWPWVESKSLWESPPALPAGVFQMDLTTR